MDYMTDAFAFTDTPVRPPFDDELEPFIKAFRAANPGASAETISGIRAATEQAPLPDLTAGGTIVRRDLHLAAGTDGREIPATILSPASSTTAVPAIFYIHGGGMVGGHRLVNIEEFLPLVSEGLAVLITADYRLAPEHRAPAQVEDCYDALRWTADHAAELGIDADRILVAGISAGGGLAAGTALLARDRGYPKLTHQVLVCPMLDDRFVTHSSRMLDREGCWDRDENLFGWDSALASERGEPHVSPYVAPARATHLDDLPRTYIDCGSTEGFRDEIIDYATRLSQAGVSVDFHMWGGGFHGFDVIFPDAALARSSRRVRDTFLRTALAPSETTE